MPRQKSYERVSEEILLSRYDLLIDNELYNPLSGEVIINPTRADIARIYKLLVDDIEEQIEYSYHRLLAEAVEVREAKEPEQKIFTFNIDINKKLNGLEQLEEILRKFGGKNINILWEYINLTYRDFNISEWLENEGYIDFMYNSDLTIFQKYWHTEKNVPPITIEILDEVRPVSREQRFSEGITHCLFEPIRVWGQGRLENANSKSSKENKRCFLKKVNKYIDIYKEGLPEEKVADICEALQIGIEITLPLLQNTKFIEERSFKKPLKTFKYINTRLDHIDEIVRTDETFEIQTLTEMNAIKKDLDSRKEFYTYKKHKYIHTINTLKGTYRLDNEYSKLINDFEKEYNIFGYKIDDITQPDLSRFIKEGTHYNSTIDFNFDNLETWGTIWKRNGEVIKHIDMEKAYVNSKKSIYYNGFLGKITDYRQVDNKDNEEVLKNLGLYRVENINFKNCEKSFKKIIKHLNCYKNGSVYPSPELRFLLNNGVTFKIIEGCWGAFENAYINFPEEFNEKCPDGVKRYAKYVGQCDSHNLNSSFWLGGSKEMVENIKCYTENDMYYTDNTAVIEYKKKNNFHFGHFTAFITSYQRLNAYEQLLEIPFDNIIRICVDGIYYTGEVELKNVFRKKDDISFSNVAGNTYLSHLTETYKVTKNKYIKPSFYGSEFHLGAGGTGKTHINVTDKGNVRLLYICPSWKLATKKREEYNINTTVLARALSKDPSVWGEIYKYYNVLVFDEVSQYSKDNIEYIKDTYGNEHKLIFCGDIGYQLPCINGEPATPSRFDKIIEYKESHRFKCDILKELASKIREDIKNNVYSGILNRKVINYFKDNLPSHIINKEELKNIYKIEDMILSATHKNKDEFTDIFKDNFEKEKYYVTLNKNGYFNGSILIEDKGFDKVKCEVRHAFTVHSIQGETANNNLFIDMRNMNKNTLLYTAISRAKKIDQIYLII